MIYIYINTIVANDAHIFNSKISVQNRIIEFRDLVQMHLKVRNSAEYVLIITHIIYSYI